MILPASLSRRPFGEAHYWPGFVDALASLLLVVIFLLSVFLLGHVYLSEAVSGRDAAMARLQARIVELGDLLALEQQNKENLEASLRTLQATLAATQAEQTDWQTHPERARMEDEIHFLNAQLESLRLQLGALQSALEAAEEKDRQAQVEIATLGNRLNAALARRVEELKRARSRFFEALSRALGERTDIITVGDRFILPAEILFDPGSADINPAGEQEIAKLAGVLREVAPLIPDDIDWVLRIDGHTDNTPIQTARFPSNWYLSSARAIAVVEALSRAGIEEQRLLAAGFGEFRPLTLSDDPASLRRNRRIEFKLTER